MQDPTKEKTDGRHKAVADHRQPTPGTYSTPSDRGISYLKAQASRKEKEDLWKTLILKLDDLAFDEGLHHRQKTKARPIKENN